MQVISYGTLFLALPFWLLVIGFVWFVRRYFSESRRLEDVLDKLSSGSTQLSQGIHSQSSSQQEDDSVDIEGGKAPLTIVVEERSCSPIPEDSAFVTPNGPLKLLLSPANQADLADFIEQCHLPPLDLSDSSTELPMARTAEEGLSDDVAIEDRHLGLLQEQAMGEGLEQNANVLSWNATCEALVESVSAFPELRYDIELIFSIPGELGRGGFGKVSEAMYKDDHGEMHHVAAKYPSEFSEDARQALRSELEMVRRVPLHPNIVHYFGGNISQYHQAGKNSSSQTDFIVMELMHTNLEHVIHGDGFKNRLSCRLLLSIALDIVTGLDHLHKHGIIHYDLKPSNVLLDEDLKAKLADFGSSKRKSHSKMTASLRGTLGYIAPEVLLLNFTGRMYVSEKLDVYSLGVVMWEMATGEYPPELQDYTPSSQGFSSHSIQSVRPVFSKDALVSSNLPDSHLAIRSLIEDCISIDPKDRPTTQELKAALLEVGRSYF